MLEPYSTLSLDEMERKHNERVEKKAKYFEGLGFKPAAAMMKALKALLHEQTERAKSMA